MTTYVLGHDRQNTSSPPIVAATQLTKRYGDLVAVDSMDLHVRAGDIYGLLGPNGAGKTTFMRMLFGLVRPDEGMIEIAGVPVQPVPVRALGGVAGFVETPRFYPYLSGRKNLELLAKLDGNGGRARIDDVLDVVELTDRAGGKVREVLLRHGAAARFRGFPLHARAPVAGARRRPTGSTPPASGTCGR